jgi:hypothetical protein
MDRRLGPTGGKRQEPDKQGRGEVGPASQRWRACAGALLRARADRRGPPGSDQEWGKDKGRLTCGSSLLGPLSTSAVRMAQAPWPEPATPHG